MTDPEIINKRMRFYFWLKFIGILIAFVGIFLAIRHPLHQSVFFVIFILLGFLFAYVVFIFQRREMSNLDPEYKSKVAAQRKSFLIGWTAILMGIFYIFGSLGAPEAARQELILGTLLITLGIFTRNGNRVALIVVSGIMGFMVIWILYILFK